LPTFVTLNVTGPAGMFDSFESLNASSDGFPAVTITVAAVTRRAADEDPEPRRAANNPATRDKPSAGRTTFKRDPFIIELLSRSAKTFGPLHRS
jgi:hypothetical protein